MLAIPENRQHSDFIHSLLPLTKGHLLHIHLLQHKQLPIRPPMYQHTSAKATSPYLLHRHILIHLNLPHQLITTNPGTLWLFVDGCLRGYWIIGGMLWCCVVVDFKLLLRTQHHKAFLVSINMMSLYLSSLCLYSSPFVCTSNLMFNVQCCHLKHRRRRLVAHPLASMYMPLPSPIMFYLVYTFLYLFLSSN